MYDAYTTELFTYIDTVLANPSMVCDEVFKACQRAREEYERSINDQSYPFYFDPNPGIKFKKFCTIFKHIEGPLGGQPFELLPWQVFVFGQILGWKKKSDNKRRFMEAHIEIPRGNGKSFMTSAFALWMLCMDEESSPQVYSVATSAAQARVVFNKSKELLLTNPRFAKYLNCEVRAHEIRCTAEVNGALSFGKFLPMSPIGKRLDGLNIHCAIIDELHAIQDPETYHKLVTGAGKRKQTLICSITTAGTSRSSIGGTQNLYATEVLNGEVHNDSFFTCIWKADDSDPEYDINTLIKANPSWEIMGQEKILQTMEKARTQAAERQSYLTFHLGKWQDSGATFLDIDRLMSGYDETLNVNDFKDVPCYVGVDLAIVDDMCVITQAFIKDGKLYVFPKYFLPEETIESSRNPRYKIWKDKGLLHSIPGPVIDPLVIYHEIHKINDNFDVQWNIVDPCGDSSLLYHLNAEGLPVQFADRGYKLSEATKVFQRFVLTERVNYCNELFEWNARNCHVQIDRNDNLYICKKYDLEKIDGIVTVLFCIKYIVDEQIFDIVSFDPFCV